MASTTTNAGLYLWDLGTDLYNHTQLAANLTVIDGYFAGFDPTSKFVKHLHTTATIPGSAALGDVVFLTAAVGGFPSNTIVRYDGSAWRAVGYEVLAALPSSGNFAGRLVMLSVADATNNFPAYSLVRYDGSAWDYLGLWGKINNGSGATNIKGMQTAFDVFVSDSARGHILKDRATGTNYRLYINNGSVGTEVVT